MGRGAAMGGADHDDDRRHRLGVDRNAAPGRAGRGSSVGMMIDSPDRDIASPRMSPRSERRSMRREMHRARRMNQNTDGGGTQVSAARRPPVRWLIVATTLTSTTVSLGGGLYLYSESVASLERTVAVLSAADLDGAARVVARSYSNIRFAVNTTEVALKWPPPLRGERVASGPDVLAALAHEVEKALATLLQVRDLTAFTVLAGSSDRMAVRDNTTAIYTSFYRKTCGQGLTQCFLGSYDPSMGLQPAGILGVDTGWTSPYINMRLVSPEFCSVDAPPAMITTEEKAGKGCQLPPSVTLSPLFEGIFDFDLPWTQPALIHEDDGEFRHVARNVFEISPLWIPGMRAFLQVSNDVSDWGRYLVHATTSTPAEMFVVDGRDLRHDLLEGNLVAEDAQAVESGEAVEATADYSTCEDEPKIAESQFSILKSCGMITQYNQGMGCDKSGPAFKLAKNAGITDDQRDIILCACRKTCDLCANCSAGTLSARRARGRGADAGGAPRHGMDAAVRVTRAARDADRIVYATSRGIALRATSACSVPRAGVSIQRHDCELRLGDIEVAYGAFRAMGGAAGFATAELRPGKYYVSLRPVETTPVNVVWARSTESVEGEVSRALYILFGFVGFVFCFDAALALAEILLLARPLTGLAKRMRYVESMELDLIVAKGGGCLREIVVIEQAFQRLVAALREYRQYLPQGCLLEGNEMLTEEGSDEYISDEEFCSGEMAASPNNVDSSPRGGMVGRHRHPSGMSAASPGSMLMSPHSGRGRRHSSSGSDAGSRRGGRQGSKDRGRDSVVSNSTAVRRTSSDMKDSGPRSIHHSLGHRAVTLQVYNLVGYMTSVRDRRQEVVSSFHGQYIQHVMLHPTEMRAVLDLFLGDKVVMTFNAMRSCNTHRLSAVRSAQKGIHSFSSFLSSSRMPGTFSSHSELNRPELQLVVGIGSGGAVCGSLGSDNSLRFSILGDVAVWAPVVERLATRWGISCLVDAAALADASVQFVYRLCERVSFAKLPRQRLDRGKAGVLAEVRYEMPEVSHKEWMYMHKEEEERAEGSHWMEYNRALELFWEGKAAAALQSIDPVVPNSLCLSPRLQGGVAEDELSEVRKKMQELRTRLVDAVAGAEAAGAGKAVPVEEAGPRGKGAAPGPGAPPAGGSSPHVLPLVMTPEVAVKAASDIYAEGRNAAAAMDKARDEDRARQEGRLQEMLELRQQKRGNRQRGSVGTPVQPSGAPFPDGTDAAGSLGVQPLAGGAAGGAPAREDVIVTLSRRSFETWSRMLSDEGAVMWVPWGLRFDAATMKLRGWTTGSPAEQVSGALRGCVGRVLTRVDRSVVQSPPDAVRAADGCSSLNLCFTGEPVEIPEGGCRVTLCRDSGPNDDRPWGLQLGTDTMELRDLANGTVASTNHEVRACRGMKLVKVNGIDVHTPQDVALLSGGARVVHLLFVQLASQSPKRSTVSPLSRRQQEQWAVTGPGSTISVAGTVMSNTSALQKSGAGTNPINASSNPTFSRLALTEASADSNRPTTSPAPKSPAVLRQDGGFRATGLGGLASTSFGTDTTALVRGRSLSHSGMKMENTCPMGTAASGSGHGSAPPPQAPSSAQSVSPPVNQDNLESHSTQQDLASSLPNANRGSQAQLKKESSLGRLLGSEAKLGSQAQLAKVRSLSNVTRDRQATPPAKEVLQNSVMQVDENAAGHVGVEFSVCLDQSDPLALTTRTDGSMGQGLGDDADVRRTVMVSRTPEECKSPIDMQFHPQTLQLIGCSHLYSSVIKGCTGMILTHVDGVPVSTAQEVGKAIGSLPLVALTFLAPGVGLDDAQKREVLFRSHMAKKDQVKKLESMLAISGGGPDDNADIRALLDSLKEQIAVLEGELGIAEL